MFKFSIQHCFYVRTNYQNGSGNDRKSTDLEADPLYLVLNKVFLCTKIRILFFLCQFCPVLL